MSVCRFCGDDDDVHRPDCPIPTKVFPSPPGLRCDRCGEPAGDSFCLAEEPREAWVRTMHVVCGGAGIARGPDLPGMSRSGRTSPGQARSVRHLHAWRRSANEAATARCLWS